jgi:hypothetical protein
MESIGAAVPSRAYHLQKGFEHGAPIHDGRWFLDRRACRTANRKVNDSDGEFTRGKSENILWAAIDSVECTDCKEMVQKVEWSAGMDARPSCLVSMGLVVADQSLSRAVRRVVSVES